MWCCSRCSTKPQSCAGCVLPRAGALATGTPGEGVRFKEVDFGKGLILAAESLILKQVPPEGAAHAVSAAVAALDSTRSAPSSVHSAAAPRRWVGDARCLPKRFTAHLTLCCHRLKRAPSGPQGSECLHDQRAA